MTNQQKGVDLLAVANKITKALFPDLYGKPGLSTDQVVLLMGSREIIHKELEKEFSVMDELIEAGKWLSAELEHSIALANFGAPETVNSDHPIRRSLDTFDAALALVQGGSNG